jgi:hypothetical protein
MKKRSLQLGIIFFALLLITACKKELSFETGGFGGTAQGELVDSLGNCKSADVRGTYAVDTALNKTSNYVIININFTAAGKYMVYTDTVNGMWFLDSGFTVSTGATTIKLKGYGTPILPKTSDFALHFNNNLCSFAVPVSGSGSTSGSSGTNGDYFPTTSGSKWIYQYIPKVGTVDTFSVNVEAGEIPLDTLSFSQFTTSIGDTYYFAKKNGNYYAYSTVDFDYTLIFDSIPQFFVYPFLKENAAKNDTWSTDPQPNYIANGTKGSTKAVFTIMQKGVQYTIAGKTYSDVIEVKRDIMFAPDGSTTYTALLSGSCFYAKGYGLIDQVFNTTPSQSVSLFQTPTIK